MQTGCFSLVCTQPRKDTLIRRTTRQTTDSKGAAQMLETLALVLIILWVLGFVSAYTMGGFIHILLVLAVIVILVRVIQGRRVL